MKVIKIQPDLRTEKEWEAWAIAKIQNKSRLLTHEEINGMELGDHIEFDSTDISKQQIVKGRKPDLTPPNYIEKF